METIGRPMEILLVEDSLMAARLTMGALSKSGIDHRLSWVADGREAHEYLLQQKKFARAPHPDLILLDLNLPEISGSELLAEIRGSEALKEIPVVIMTGAVEEHSEEEFASLDVQGYLVKPVDIDQFLGLIEKLRGYWKKDMIISKAR